MNTILNLDVVVDSPNLAIDMKSGLETLQGVSDSTRTITEAVLTGHIAERLSHKSSVRTTLKQTFSGSYGQVFSLDIENNLSKAFSLIGKNTLSELIAYFLNEAIFSHTGQLSTKAQREVDKLGDSAELLVEQLRKSALSNIHEISTKFDYEVKVRFRQSRDNQTLLARFNNETAQVLLAEESVQVFELVVSITRLNINTGNGRLLIHGEHETVAFGFARNYRGIGLRAKKKFSQNLNHNNGLDEKFWEHLNITASAITLKSGKVIKYVIKGLES